MAREVMALAAMKAGKTDEARKYLESLLGDRTTPPSMMDRVQILLGVLTDQDASKAKPASRDATTPQQTAPPAPAPAAGQENAPAKK